MRLPQILKEIEKYKKIYLEAKKIYCRIDDDSVPYEQWLESNQLKDEDILLVNILVK